MKRLLPVCVGLLLAVCVGLLFVAAGRIALLVPYLFAAQDRAISSPDRLAAITIEPKADMNGTVTALILTAHFQSIDSRPSGEVTARPIGSVQVDLLKANNAVVVERTKTQYDYREVSDILQALALREWRLVHPEALVTRRAMREPEPK